MNLRLGPALLLSLLAFGSLTVACSGASEDTASGQDDLSADRRKHKDAGTDAHDAASDVAQPTPDASSGDDGPPSRVACTSNFGSALSPGGFGRLDGFVVAVVVPGGGACNADSDHVHIQVAANGSTYDVAVNTDSGFIAEKDVTLPGAAWSEGWHAKQSLDYPTDLDLHTADFSTGSKSVISQELETALANTNHISVFATTYSKGGIHLVHRHLMHDDGAIVLDPLSATSHLFAFHFSDQPSF